MNNQDHLSGGKNLRWPFRLWTSGLVCLGLFFVYQAAPKSSRDTGRRSDLGAKPVSHAITDRVAVKPIQEIRVGQRVIAQNPKQQFDDSLGRSVDRPTWRRLSLRAVKRDGSECLIELIRPLWWVQQRQAAVGETVLLSVPECGIDGDAEVLTVGPCPPLALGPGSVVISTFAHQSARVVDLRIDGLDEPIGVTSNHLIWSEDRQDFVGAGMLDRGERVGTRFGPSVVESLSTRGPPEPVYNLEVFGQHVYCVSRRGLLVHNNTMDDCLELVQITPPKPKYTDNGGTLGSWMSRRSAPKSAAALRNGSGVVSRTSSGFGSWGGSWIGGRII